MIGKIVASLVGAEMQRRRGGNGAAGAAAGAAAGVVASAVIRRLGPLGILVGGAYVAKKALDRRSAGSITPPPATGGELRQARPASGC